MIIIDDVIQGSDEWHTLRLGNPGASSMNKIITSTGQPSKQAKEYCYQLAGEYITGKHEETFKSFHMDNGLAREAEARALFELIHGVEVRQVGLVYKDERKAYHCSPDGLIGNIDGYEVKCPMMKTHIKYLFEKKLPTDYFVQVQSSLYISERLAWWFTSYYPGLEPFIIKVEPDLKFHARLEEQLESFIFELAKTIKKLKEVG